MNPETKFGKSLRKKFPRGHVIRVENPANPGTPDLNVCIDGVESWIELKQVRSLPKRELTPVFTGCLEPHQAVWHIKRGIHGGRSFIIGFVEEINEFFIIPGNLADRFNSYTLSELRSHSIKLEKIWT